MTAAVVADDEINTDGLDPRLVEESREIEKLRQNLKIKREKMKAKFKEMERKKFEKK